MMPTKKREMTEFHSYEVNDEDRVVGVFSDYDLNEYYSLSLEDCEERLRNLKISGLPHEQTLKAIEGWPDKPGRVT